MPSYSKGADRGHSGATRGLRTGHGVFLKGKAGANRAYALSSNRLAKALNRYHKDPSKKHLAALTLAYRYLELAVERHKRS